MNYSSSVVDWTPLVILGGSAIVVVAVIVFLAVRFIGRY